MKLVYNIGMRESKISNLVIWEIIFFFDLVFKEVI